MQTYRTTNQGRTCTLLVTDSIPEYLTTTKPYARIDRRDDWTGESFDECARLCDTGDDSLVAESDKLMTKAESLLGFDRHSFHMLNDVIGAAPNVGAFLAGNPANMRRRARTTSQQAPLTVLVDLTCSAGNKRRDLVARGAACLTLLRLLSGIRPVTIYAGTNMDAGNEYSMIGIMTPIDSTPLNVGRAAHILSSTAFNRRLGYGYLMGAHGSGCSWPFYNCDKFREVSAEIWGTVFGGDILYVPPLFVRDQIIADPVEWLRDMLAKYGQTGEE